MPAALAPPPKRSDVPSAGRLNLREGMRLRRPEFHRRYEAIGEADPDFRAELIGGVVYLKDPMGTGNPHAVFHAYVIMWLGFYLAKTRGVRVANTPTVALDDLGEPEPDAVLRRDGGPLTPGSLIGPQDLVVEVSDTTLQKDLGVKFDDYERAGVPEYLVVDVNGRRVHWFVRGAGGAFVDLPPDADGLLKSHEFPGLWLDPAALFAEDVAGLEAAVVTGVAARGAA